MQKNKVLDDLAFKIFEKEGPEKIKDLSHLKMALKYADKDMFQKFRDGALSYDQLLSRVEGKKTGQSYVVLDDLKGKI